MSEPSWHQMAERMNDAADSDLGAAVAMVDAAGLFDQGDLLERAERRYEFAYEVEERWGDSRIVMRPAVMIDPAVLDALTPETLRAQAWAGRHAWRWREVGDESGTHTSVSSMVREDRY